MTSMLLDVVAKGTGKNAAVPGYDIAAKTGSTQVDWTTEGTKDQWFVGYTPNVVLSMWMGFDNTDEEHYMQTDSYRNVSTTAGNILSKSLPNLKKESFDIKSAATVDEEEKREQQEKEEQESKDTGSIIDSVKETAGSISSGVKEGAKKTKDWVNSLFGN